MENKNYENVAACWVHVYPAEIWHECTCTESKSGDRLAHTHAWSPHLSAGMEVSNHAQFRARCHFNDIRRLIMLNLLPEWPQLQVHMVFVSNPFGAPQKAVRKCLLAIISCHFRRRLSSEKADILLCILFGFICMPTVWFSVTDAN